jgi:hypothetical protein
VQVIVSYKWILEKKTFFFLPFSLVLSVFFSLACHCLLLVLISLPESSEGKNFISVDGRERRRRCWLLLFFLDGWSSNYGRES